MNDKQLQMFAAAFVEYKSRCDDDMEFEMFAAAFVEYKSRCGDDMEFEMFMDQCRIGGSKCFCFYVGFLAGYDCALKWMKESVV